MNKIFLINPLAVQLKIRKKVLKNDFILLKVFGVSEFEFDDSF